MPDPRLFLRTFIAAAAFATSGMAYAQTLQVTATEPARHALAVPVAAAVTLRFDRPLATASVTAASVRVAGRWSGPVAGTFVFSDADRAVTLQPNRPFSAGETVFVVVSQDVEAADGTPLRTAGYAFQFQTAAAAAPARIFQEIDIIAVRDSPDISTRVYGGLGADLDGDGWLDLTLVNEDTSDLRLFLNRGDGSGLLNAMVQPTTATGLVPSPSEPADFNGDGNVDVCTANISGDSVSVVLGQGNGTFGAQQEIAVGNRPRGIAVLDADGDGDFDIVTANHISSNLTLLRNNGSGVFVNAATFEGGGSGEWGLAAADMDNDGIYDLVVGSRDDQQVHVLRGQGDGTFSLVSSRSAGGSVWMIATGDVNGDGHMDVSTANSSSNGGSILRGNGDGTLGAATVTPTGAFALATDLGDLDGDGDLDWVLSSFNGARWDILANDGAGNYGLEESFPAPSTGSCAILLDLDNDLDLDLALLDETADLVFLLANRGALFVDGFESGDLSAWSASSWAASVGALR